MDKTDKKEISISEIFINCPDIPDLTNTKHLELIINNVEKVLELCNNREELEQIENTFIAGGYSAFILLSIKIAISKLIIADITNDLLVSVVFAVYKENNRIKTQQEHPHGEDFLIRKINQLNYLFKGKDNIKWELLIVDDGCPNHSGKIAQDIINKQYTGNNVKVLFLQEAIDKQLSVIQGLSSTSDSQKGGSIAYGMWHAAKNTNHNNHIIIFTDADLSTHLGQIGLLLEPLLYNKKSVAIGSRREHKSVVIKQGVRNNRGKLFIYLWKRMIPDLHYITDTQCGFKAFRKDIVLQIIEDLIEKKFAFDIELLLKTELIKRDSIAKVPVAWIDSEAASTTTDLQPYLTMLKSIAGMYKKYLPYNKTSESFADFILSINENDFNKLVENIPAEIKTKEATEFADYDKVSVADLQAII